MAIEVGSIVKGTVVKVFDYGAIVRLAEGKSGFIHISELSNSFVSNIHDVLQEGQQITANVLRFNDHGRFELSIKQMDTTANSENIQMNDIEAKGGVRAEKKKYHGKDDVMNSKPITFEDRLSRFLKDSNERQMDLKRHIESKRGHK
jgi:S1 RNA binding domain protein